MVWAVDDHEDLGTLQGEQSLDREKLPIWYLEFLQQKQVQSQVEGKQYQNCMFIFANIHLFSLML